MLEPLAAETFDMPRGPVGCLLVHGFGGSPGEMKGLGDYLAKHDVSVLGVLVAGHGGTPEDFGRVRWQAWAASVDKALDELQQRCAHVFIAGLSLGGLLALHVAAGRRVDGIVVMSAPVTLGRLDAVFFAMPILRRVVHWWYPLRGADVGDPAVHAELAHRFPAGRLSMDDPQALAWMRDNVRVSTRAIDQLGRLMRRVRRDLGRVRAPMLVLQGLRDEWVPAECPGIILAGTSSRDKELLWFEHSSHGLLSGPQREEIFQAVYRFIVTHCPAEL